MRKPPTGLAAGAITIEAFRLAIERDDETGAISLMVFDGNAIARIDLHEHERVALIEALKNPQRGTIQQPD